MFQYIKNSERSLVNRTDSWLPCQAPSWNPEKEGQEGRLTVSEVDLEGGIFPEPLITNLDAGTGDIHLRSESSVSLDTATSASNFTVNSLHDGNK